MPFSLGSVELLLLAVLAILALLLYIRQHRTHRAGIVAFVFALLAALITPADTVSMVLLFAAFTGVYLFGSRYPLDTPTRVS